MYHRYFGLDEQAFSIAVNPRYLYMSVQHREALAHLLYGVSSGGFVMLTGEVGTGKTTIIRCLLEQLPDNADLAVVLNPSASARDLLCSICDELRVPYAVDENSLKILTDKLTDFLVENHQAGRKTIVLIDEAQLLRISTLEQVRLLTNLETNTEKLLQIILVGQPELNELLAKPALRQLSQRITARYHLRPLNEEETEAYIKHRLTVAGLAPGQQPFPARIVRKVHRISGGIPRLINVLCDRMLLGAYSREVSEIDADICRQASIEVMGQSHQKPVAQYRQHAIYVGSGIFAVALLSFAVVLLTGGRDGAQAPAVVAEGAVLRVSANTLAGAEQGGTEPWYRNQDRALAGLLETLNLEYEGALYPCWLIAKEGFHCETHNADTWEGFLQINRPAVLTIVTPSRHTGYITLVGMDEAQNRAWVRFNGQVQPMSLSVLGSLWSGEFVFVWQRPEHFQQQAVGLGSRGPLVSWVARQFAALDQQSAPLTQEHFNSALQQRVKIFQRSQELEDDGWVGMQTLLKLNEVLGRDVPLTELSMAWAATKDGL